MAPTFLRIDALDDWLKENEHDLFSRKRIMIPTPHFVVFYNGTEKRPEYEEMRLSKSFYHQTEKPEIELICKAYNINPKNNQDLKKDRRCWTDIHILLKRSGRIRRI